MKLGIIGLPGSGKTTVFRALTGSGAAADRKGHQEPGLGVVTVQDDRLDFLVNYQKPKKITPVHVEYMDIPGITGEAKQGAGIGDRVLAHIRPLDALIHCVRFFDSPSLGPADPLRDYLAAEQDMVLSDLAMVEKRLERVEKDYRKGKKELHDELEALLKVKPILDSGRPLRVAPDTAGSEKLRGFAFLSLKPLLVMLNAGDEKKRPEISESLEKIRQHLSDQHEADSDWLYADMEAEITQLSEEEAAEFLADIEMDQKAKTRIVKKSFDLLKLIVFFTVGEPEVRAWPLRAGLTAVKAAGTIHSDMERGFIRAEVVAYDDFKQAGSMAAVHKAGKLRLEGRDYVMRDGDIVLFRFNV